MFEELNLIMTDLAESIRGVLTEYPEICRDGGEQIGLADIRRKVESVLQVGIHYGKTIGIEQGKAEAGTNGGESVVESIGGELRTFETLLNDEVFVMDSYHTLTSGENQYNLNGWLIIPPTWNRGGDDVPITKIANIGAGTCKGLIIPTSITEIASYAFAYHSELETIVYKGTVEQWNAITKASDSFWAVSATEVICSDGTVAL